MRIYAPVKDATGTWASVRFVNGVGETNDPRLIEWFKNHGYRIEQTDESVINFVLEETEQLVQPDQEPDFDKMTPNELREWMRENGYGAKIKNTRNKEKLLEILRG